MMSPCSQFPCLATHGGCSGLNGSLPRDNVAVLTPGPGQVTLFGKRVFVDAIKDLVMRSSRITQWALNLMTSTLMRDRREDRHGQRSKAVPG